MRAARVREEQADELAGLRVPLLDERDRLRERAGLPRADKIGQLGRFHALCGAAGARSTSMPRVNRTAATAATSVMPAATT